MFVGIELLNEGKYIYLVASWLLKLIQSSSRIPNVLI